MDAVLLGQFAYYVYQRRRRARLLALRPDTPGTASPAEPAVMTMPIAWMVLLLGVVAARPIAEMMASDDGSTGLAMANKADTLRLCNPKPQLAPGMAHVGTICAWVSALCYFFSRYFFFILLLLGVVVDLSVL